MNKFLIYSFYRFCEINDIEALKKEIDRNILDRSLKGTILIASEGLNGTISGTKIDLDFTLKLIRKILNIRKLNIKINFVDFLPFNKLKVRIKNEIVSLGQGNLRIHSSISKRMSPDSWNKLILNSNVKLVDTRNTYEIKIGKFKNAINPQTTSFREFPKSFKKLGLNKNDHIAIYCTGGIRCEKASVYLNNEGYKNIYQLDGGILNYLKYVKNNNLGSLWSGECFVFDKRVSVNKKLESGQYEQCYGCRHPLSNKDIRSKKYKKGIHCPYCYELRSHSQIERAKTRQNQIEIAEKNNINHPFKKVTLKNY